MDVALETSVDSIIVIGASTGGLEAIKTIVRSLPPDFEIPIFIVWHMSPSLRGILPDMLNKLNTIPASNAGSEPIVSNHIYVAPPDHHLLIEEGSIRITRGPKENRFRPAVDPLFRSAAYSYGKRVIGIVLSGSLDDGTAGLWRIKDGGGTTIVQDPLDAQVSSMPESALRDVDIDYCVPVAEMADLLVKLGTLKTTDNIPVMKDQKTKIEIGVAAENNALERSSLSIGELSPFACPECHGVLSRITEGNISRFRCHTGHAYSIDALMSSITEKIEDNLYSALRGIDESILLLNHIGEHFTAANDHGLAATYFKKALEAMERGNTIRKMVFTHENISNEKHRMA